MVTQRKINIPIFDYKLTIIITDTWDEVRNRLPDTNINLNSARAITMSNRDIGGSIVAVLSDCLSSVVHECVHIKNGIWNYIGYRPQADNDEVDAYLITYIYERIMEVFRKHNS